MDIFESLENLNVSEECFEDIVGLVEEYINERNKFNKQLKNNWERDKLPGGYFTGNEISRNKKDIYYLKNFTPPRGKSNLESSEIKGARDRAVDRLAQENHKLLQRGGESPTESAKRNEFGSRKGASQKGSTKESFFRFQHPDPLVRTSHFIRNGSKGVIRDKIEQMRQDRVENSIKNK